VKFTGRGGLNEAPREEGGPEYTMTASWRHSWSCGRRSHG